MTGQPCPGAEGDKLSSGDREYSRPESPSRGHHTLKIFRGVVSKLSVPDPLSLTLQLVDL